ncbi:hypothetical protein [Sneathiella glossodoripedis]|uniref:hypothetical protein n=1 Tax=Sneathiella glossodoripedis TaxID=418853 RepID=UPI00047200C2|nr:hypothetical protein [Sneathiella glossodoripedis]
MNTIASPADERRHGSNLETAFDQGKKSYFDAKRNKSVIRVLPGEHYVTSDPSQEVIVTILGSCVAACIRDPHTGFGGMNHFMLPQSDTGNWGSVNANMRYGNFAMETLINEVLKTGCPRERLEVKLFGGANVTTAKVLVGDLNSKFALNYLKYEGFAAKSYDLGGDIPRRIHFYPDTGKVDRLLLRRKDDSKYLREEIEYQNSLPSKAQVSGKIDLF